MDANENKGFEEAYKSETFADYYSAKHEQSTKLRFRDGREQAMWARLLQKIPQINSVLDCPAGAGRYWRFLHGLAEQITAVDSSAEMMASGRKFHPEYLPNQCEVAMAQTLPFADDSFDLVFCSRLLHHFPQADDRQEILKSFRRVSKDYVAFSTWRTGNWKSFRGSSKSKAPTRFFTPLEEILKDVAAADLDVVRICHKQRLISPIVALLCRIRS